MYNFVVTDVKGSQITVKSQVGREYKHNCSHLRTFKTTHEIIQPSFVGIDDNPVKREGEYHGDNNSNPEDVKADTIHTDMYPIK